jgi:acetolactate synthase-1/2/3 large subunit
MIMHLTDALLLHGKQRWVCCHHEQAAVMGAEAYGRYTGRLGVAYVTAGPGALNTLTGVVGALVDTAPLIVVSGQAKLSQAVVTGPRQFALQGFNTLPLFSQVTKYAVMLADVRTIRHDVEKAIWLATHGRVGPVWIECPVDVQGMPFDPTQYEGFTPPDEDCPGLGAAAADVVRRLSMAKRPLILAGAGVRQAGAADLLRQVAQAYDVPVVTSRLGLDLLGFDDPHFVGHPGTYGDRPANFAVQNADLLLVVGCRLAVGLVGYDYQGFAPRAVKIMVDVDEAEMDKPSVTPDIKILADAGAFLAALADLAPPSRPARGDWPALTQAWKHDYPVDLPEYAREAQGLNSYHFMRLFSEALPSEAVVVCDTGSCFHIHAQAFRVKQGQRHIITGGLSTMGYCPAATGVAVAAAGRPVYCITGDGSFQFNIQELQTVVHHNLPIAFVVLSNGGYLLIRHTQRNFLQGHYIGTHKETGVSFPDLSRLAAAYGLDYRRIDDEPGLTAALPALLGLTRPLLVEVTTPPDQLLQPRVGAKMQPDGSMVSMPYDNMFPYLSDEEYAGHQVWKKG